MSGYNDDKASLANGIPARHIGPETGASGAATSTNKAGTGEGTNEADDSRPAPASGLRADVTPAASGEGRSFAADVERDGLPANDEDGGGVESAGGQIADGGDRLDRDRRP